MFSEYKTQVINSYERKRKAGTLSFNLLHLTPARVKKECIAVLLERSLAADERILNNFFGNSSSLEEYTIRIKKTHPDKFRPLINHLKEKTENPDDRNIELLAWLIDFNPRPYLFGHDYRNKTEGPLKTNGENQNEVNESLIREAPIEIFDRLKAGNNSSEESGQTKVFAIEKKKGEILDVKPASRLSNKIKAVASLEVVGILCMVLLLSFGKIGFFKEKNCMYWTGNRYEQTYFDQKIPNVQIVALDTFRLNYFRKIVRLDTLKESCVGKIWYSKIAKKVEFFTTGGMHPEHVEKPLKPVSKYIFNKYILKKEQ